LCSCAEVAQGQGMRQHVAAAADKSCSHSSHALVVALLVIACLVQARPADSNNTSSSQSLPPLRLQDLQEETRCRTRTRILLTARLLCSLVEAVLVESVLVVAFPVEARNVCRCAQMA
jgi:hypothetical protein